VGNTDFPIQALSPGDLMGLSGPAAMARWGRGGDKPGDQALMQAAKDFESVLLQRLTEEMSHTIPDSGLLEDTGAEQVQSMFWGFLAEHVADQGGMGLWKDLYEQWSRPPSQVAQEPAGAKEPSP
jgi:Rod binding domain-containing protein